MKPDGGNVRQDAREVKSGHFSRREDGRQPCLDGID
jgi:hypothetical protein